MDASGAAAAILGRALPNRPQLGAASVSPRHPDTAGLLASTVGASNRGSPLPSIAGAPPDLSALPAGCSFAPRCAYASAQCRSERPLVLAAGSQTLACWQPLAAARA